MLVAEARAEVATSPTTDIAATNKPTRTDLIDHRPYIR